MVEIDSKSLAIISFSVETAAAFDARNTATTTTSSCVDIILVENINILEQYLAAAPPADVDGIVGIHKSSSHRQFPSCNVELLVTIAVMVSSHTVRRVQLYSENTFVLHY